MDNDAGTTALQSPEDADRNPAKDPATAGALVEHELDASNPIEQPARAILQLFRSLAIGKTIAVVGSGASVIYGYPDWQEMVDQLCTHLTGDNCKARKNATEKLDDIKRILKEDLELKSGEKKKVAKSPRPPSDQDPFLSRDELLALCDEAVSCLDKESKDAFDLFQASLFRRSKRYHRLESAIGNHPLRKELRKLISRLRITDASKKTKEGLTPKSPLPADISGLIFSLPIRDFKAPSPTELQKRELINAPRNLLDPLSELRSRIGIHRFVTFNYDLEIEALLEDIDYPFGALTRLPDPEERNTDEEHNRPDRFTESRLGGSAHSISLSAENAPDLITIASIPSSANDLIVHVHGAITRPCDMVVTQSGYNAIYYEDHEYRRGFEDARRLLFGGNAVLYIGLGLNEEDLMRPLRYLSANLRNRPLFALIPLLSNERRAVAFERRIKSSYGVNVITYGRAYADIPEIWKKNQRPGVPHPRTSSDSENFISLGDELANIRKSFHLAGDRDFKLEKLVSGLGDLIKNKARFPRLHSTRSPLIEIAQMLLGRTDLLDPEKADGFVRRLQTIAITVALCDALEYMQGVASTWQNRLKIASETPLRNESSILSHYGAVRQASEPSGPLKIDQPSEHRTIHKMLKLDMIESGTRILMIPSGKGRGSVFSYIKKYCVEHNERTQTLERKAINIGHSIRKKTILSEILVNLGGIRFLCLHEADAFLDDREPRLATLFIEALLHKLRNASLPKKKNRGLHLLLIVRTERAADFFSKAFSDNPYKPCDPDRLVIHDENTIASSRLDEWHSFKRRYSCLAKEMIRSRWAYLAVLGAKQNLPEPSGSASVRTEDTAEPRADAFLEKCNIALRDRLFSISEKHRDAALCEVILEERHRLIQRSMHIKLRNQVIVENIILKWMYAIPIPIDRVTIRHIPEIDKLIIDSRRSRDNEKTGKKNDKENEWTGHEVDEETINQALLALKNYRFIFEIDYDPTAPENSPLSRYILHGAIQQLLGYRRGFSLDAPAARDHGSISLSLMLMDGGPLLGPIDFKSTCALYEKLVKLPADGENRIAIRSAYALIRFTIHTQSAMRAELAEDPKEYSNSALHSHLRRLARLRSLSTRQSANGHPPLLYRECELWLLNELGVVRYLQGNMHDAVFAFRECMEASGRIMVDEQRSMSDMDPALAPRLSINLALCLIERARFHDAESLVEKALHGLAKQTGASDNPEYRLLWALLQGCLAQIQLLTAQLDSARGTVEKVLPIIRELGALGAQAWLHSVEASAALAREAHKEADEAISLALAAARGAHRPDLILNLELSAIEIQLGANGYSREVVLHSLARLESLERGAIRLGSHRSRCAAMLIRARALLTIEQMEPAREAIIEAISIAQLNGMRLKRISGLILLVALMAQRGEREPAKKLLRSVKLAANRARYVRAVADIERLQQAMDIEGGVPHWAGFVSDFGSTDRRRSSLR